MGNSRLNASIYAASGDGKYYPRYPYGNAPLGGLAALAAARAGSAAGLLSGIKLAAAPGSIALATGVLTTSSGSPTFAANRPSGLTTITDRQWNPTDSGISGGVLPPSSLSGTDSFGWTWFQGANHAPLIATPSSLTSTIGVTIPSPPSGNATVMAVKYPSGFSAGDVPFGIFVDTVPTTPTMYVCCEIFVPSSFNANGNNIKWFIIEGGSSNNDVNHVAELYSGGDSRMAWFFGQGGGLSSINYGGGDSAPGSPTTPSGALVGPLSQTPSNAHGYAFGAQLGNWHICEWLFISETTAGTSSNGVFAAWVDGTQISKWANINFNEAGFATPGFNTISFEPYYGGGGGAAPGIEYLLMARTLVAMG